MASGFSGLFAGAGHKLLSAVDAESTRSHQHEFGTTAEMRDFLGTPDDKVYFPSTIVYLTDDPDTTIIHPSTLTYYDTRKAKAHRSPEYRCYFLESPAFRRAHEHDSLILGMLHSGRLVAIISAPEVRAMKSCKAALGIGTPVGTTDLSASSRSLLKVLHAISP